MKVDIFDLENTSDLPKELVLDIGKKERNKRKKCEFLKELISLFDEEPAKVLTVGEVVAAYWRVFTKGTDRPIVEKKRVRAALYNLSREERGEIVRVGKALFCKST